ncbi:hypothetical protein FA13DRAFT_1731787 [Coprinellus micaceus]|uniref:Uncharacterized protein n=1 Tax=Coprinellus micaceus TaxID=71717 RepID=A0A4Y7TEI0_COPMI|nr:hypothetical protein FA13DRAFT_1731787 [Coprinellus micaceus]
MSSNWNGVQYNIYSASHGGILQFGSAGSGLFATLGADVRDVSQQWIIHPSGAQYGFSIENWEFGNYASVDSDPWVRSSTAPRTWYLVPIGNNVNGLICNEPGCSLVWAPLSLVDPLRSDSNDVVLVQRSGATFELWQFVEAGTSTVRPGNMGTSASSQTSITTTTPHSSVLPSTTTTTTTATAASLFTTTETWSSSTEIGTIFETSSTRSYPPAATRPALRSCAPCGNSQCSFTPSGEPVTAMYSVLIGQPVANCNSGSQESTTTKFGGTYELQKSFSVEVTSGAGLGFLGPSISAETKVGTANTTRIERAQEIEVTIRPGQIGALVANITYVTTPGQIRVDRSTLAFVSVEPENVLGYSVVYTSCDSQFQALTLPKVECTPKSSGFTSMPGAFGRQSMIYLALILLGSLSSLF